MGKPRVIISSDIGGSDPDDMESMAHALIYADKFDIEAIISTPTKNSGRASDIHKALDAYAKDYNNLKTWGDYPTPSELKSVVYQGAINVPGKQGYASPTAASKAIIKAAHEGSSSDPVYVLTWGAMTDVAQALHDDPSIAGKIRILSSNGWNGTQDPHSRDYIYNNHKNVWWIESKSTHRGIYVDSAGKEGNSFKMNEAKGHGALGDYFYNARPWGVKMGDSWSIAYLVDQADNNNPGANSWGGTFVKTGHGPNFWTDDPSSSKKIGSYNGAAHLREHQSQIYNDMYKMFDRADKAKSGAPNNPPPPKNTDKDDPVVAKNDSASTDKNKAVVVKVLQNDSAADGGLKLAKVDAASSKGGKVVMHSDGTVTYTPKSGYTGLDSFKYTAKDADGDTHGATVSVNVKASGSSTPAPSLDNGSHHNVVAMDDKYTMDAGKKLYFNTSHLVFNDKGADGGLKASVAAKSANGVTLEKWNDGTVVYKAAKANGTDKIDYVLKDKDGSTDTGSVLITIKNGVAVASNTPSDPTPPSHSTGSSHGNTSSLPQNGNGKGVVAADDSYKVDGGKTLYFNTRFVTGNDKGHGDLNVVSVDAVSDRGVKISWGAEGTAKDGTLVYKAQAGFHGTDKIDYKVVDKHGGYDIGTILIHVNDLS
jgi:hypothetical protein